MAPFHNFYKIVSLRSVFAPVEFSSKTLLSWITQRSELCNSVSQFLQNCFTSFSFRSCGVFFENSFILDYAAFGTMQLRFIIFYKIISLRSVPHNQARPTANPPSPINYFALYSEAGSLPRLKLRTAYAFLPPGASALILFGHLSYGGH